MKEYIVTLKNYDDLNEFYIDMETPGGPITIPGRSVDCKLRRSISRNTHYYLTEEEAEQIRNDERVLSVELIPSELGIFPYPNWYQTGNFEKSSTVDTNDKNWGLYRCISGSQLSNWGTNGSFTQTTQSIVTTSSGKHVDVVIVDSHVNPNHPEFAYNSDGTGGSRVNQFNWFQYSSALNINSTGSYDYSDISSNHGTHVAGTVAGNTQGWARDANIYNMEFNYVGTNITVSDWALVIFDYLRYFHKNKPINPLTGRRNPTITNHSWGYSYGNISLSNVTSVNYRSTTTSLSGMDNATKKVNLENNGVPVPGGTYLYRMPARITALDADIQDAITDGVVVVSSAGNSYWNSTTSTTSDWNNYIISSGSTYYHSRGASPGSADNVICVGSIGVSTQEYKSNFSNYGSRVDIWAPGSNIISSVYDSTAGSEFGVTLVNDPRNSSYKLGSISGTSMSSPQVTGLLACLAEQVQNLNQSESRNHILDSSKKNQIGSTGGLAGDYTSLGDSSNNRFLYYRPERSVSGLTQPKNNLKTRPSTGMTYPRINIQRISK